MDKKVLFINGSPNKNGNTVSIMKKNYHEFDQLDLVDYKIYGYGQTFKDDQFQEVVEQIYNYDVIVLGSPVYWHNMSGMIRNLLDRFYGHVKENIFEDKQMQFIIQGAAPEQWMIDDSEYTIKRFCKLYGFEYKGLIK